MFVVFNSNLSSNRRIIKFDWGAAINNALISIVDNKLYPGVDDFVQELGKRLQFRVTNTFTS